MRKAIGTTAVVVAALAAGPLAPAVAYAHGTVARHGQDYAAVGPGHNHLVWCDQEQDGHRTRVYYKTRNGQNHWTDWDGGDPGCGSKTTQSEIVYFAVEEEGEGYGPSVWA